MFIPIYINNYRTMENNEKYSNMTMLQHGAEVLDEQIMSLMNIVQVTFADTRYRNLTYHDPSILKNNYYLLPQVVSNFKGLLSPNNIIADAGIIINDEVILTRYRIFLANDAYNFYEDFFLCQGCKYQDWLSLAHNAALTSGFIPELQYRTHDFNVYSGIAFVLPWTDSYKKMDSSLFYAIIRTRELLHTITSAEIVQRGFVLTYDPQGNIIFNHQHNPNSSKNQYFTISTELKNSRLRIVVGIPYSIIDEQLAPIRTTFLIYIISIFVIGSALVLFFAYNSNKPIRKIVNTIKRVYTSDVDNISEYEYITTAVNDMNKTIYTYSQTIEMQKKLIRNNAFEKALIRGLHNKNHLTDFKRLFPGFPCYFQIAVINYEMNAESNMEATVSLQLDLLDEISKLLPEEIYKQLFDEQLVILLLPVKNEGDSQFWISPLTKIYMQITAKFPTSSFRIALSEVFSDCQELAEAFLQVRNILFMAGANKELAVWQLNNFPQRSYRLPFDYINMQQLYDALLAGDIETTNSILNSIEKSLTQADAIHEIAIHQTCNSLHNLLLRVKIENMSLLSSIYIPINKREKRIAEILKEYNKCCIKICNIFKEAHIKNEDNFSKSICNYILENFINSELYAKTVSDHFGISDTTLQKIIKKATGKTFSKYVEDLRLEKAYDLLKNTDISINDIATTCGFTSSNSFYKAFRRKYSFPPSTLRSNKHLVIDSE